VQGLEDTVRDARKKVSQAIHGVDKLVGRMVEDRIGVLNQRLRASLMQGVAETLGDIIAYQGKKLAIQARLWKAIADYAPGYGTEAKRISIVAHSLGGVIAFDTMMAPAGGTPMYVESFVTFGSQSAFFQTVDPRPSLPPYHTNAPITLPNTMQRWFNLWDVADFLAFTAGTVFRLSDGSVPEDVPVASPFSVMLDQRLWLHSAYWESSELASVLRRALAPSKASP
jgi:hypothetical protein